MATFSKKIGGKEVGQAAVYAKPHTMKGAVTDGALPQKTGAALIDQMNMSVGGYSKGNVPPTKTSGVKMRGAGAATKGVMSRGPMA